MRYSTDTKLFSCKVLDRQTGMVYSFYSLLGNANKKAKQFISERT